MEIVYVEARKKVYCNFDEQELLNKLPESLTILTTVQFLDYAETVRQFLLENNFFVKTLTGRHSLYDMQMLGCDLLHGTLKDSMNAFLYIGEGKFHPKAIVLRTNKPVYVLDPNTDKLSIFDRNEADALLKKEKGAIARFLTAKDIGVIISTKPGQFHLEKALNLGQEFPDKIFHFLVCDTIDFYSLQDFSFIECFVNAACPRIAYDDSVRLPVPIVDIEAIRKFGKKN